MEIAAPKPKLLDRVREAVRLRHYSRRTEQAYVGWIRRFILFHGKRHPRELGEPAVTSFLSHLASRGVSASTQNQALSAILFLYEVVLEQRIAWMKQTAVPSINCQELNDAESNTLQRAPPYSDYPDLPISAARVRHRVRKFPTRLPLRPN